MLKQLLLCVLSFWLCASAAVAQKMVSAQFLGSRTRQQIANQFSNPLVQYGARFYRITYTTKNTANQPDTVSGLIVVPQDSTRVFPRLVYQHGTSSTRLEVPSYNILNNGEGNIGLLFAGMGFVTLMPDYLGLGVAKGFHPYVHAASESWVAADMLRALPDFVNYYGSGLYMNDQLFITGYSQGGHASMAFHRDAEGLWKDEFKVTAAAHLSGPYSIGEVMRDLALSDDVYNYVAFFPHAFLAYQRIYGNLFNFVGEVVRAPYVAPIEQFRDNNNWNLETLNFQLISLLTNNEGASRPVRLLNPPFVQEILADDWHPVNVALRDNNVYAWAPKAPTRLFYCMGDNQVPFRNSIVARDTMLARGATDLQAIDVNPTANHVQCATPALTNTLLFFLNYRDIGYVVGTEEPSVEPLEVQPNPTRDAVWLMNLPAEGQIQVFDVSGRLRHQVAHTADRYYRLDLSTLEGGLYVVRFVSGGRIWQSRVALLR